MWAILILIVYCVTSIIQLREMCRQSELIDDLEDALLKLAMENKRLKEEARNSVKVLTSRSSKGKEETTPKQPPKQPPM